MAHELPRRTMLTTATWGIPVVTLAIAAPTATASETGVTFSWAQVWEPAPASNAANTLFSVTNSSATATAVMLEIPVFYPNSVLFSSARGGGETWSRTDIAGGSRVQLRATVPARTTSAVVLVFNGQAGTAATATGTFTPVSEPPVTPAVSFIIGAPQPA